MSSKNSRQRHRRWAAVYGLLALLSLTMAVVAAQDGVDLTHLVLGDGRASTSAQRGYFWSCQTQFGTNQGAFTDGPWINGDGTWNRLEKAMVDGEVEWTNFQFTLDEVNGERVVSGNGLPPHTTGVFPIQSSDDAYQYDRNPNSIKEQTISFNLPQNPTENAEPSCAGGVVGIMLTGIPLFSGFDAEGRDAVAHEVQDTCDGHPQREGQYHYHDLSPCIEKYEAGTTHSDLVGYAFDGFGIYGFRGEDGQLLTNDDLDECHGHTHEIEWDGVKVVMYHYHATTEFPYVVGCYRGTAVRGQLDSGEGGQPGGQGNNGQPGGNGQNGNGQNPPPPPGGNGQNPPPPPGGGNGQNPPPPPGGGNGQNPPPPPGGGGNGG